MNEDFVRRTSEMFGAAWNTRIPDNLQDFAEERVAKTREAYRKINTVAKEASQALEEVVLAAQTGAKALGEKVMTDASKNMESAFDAAQAIARARTLPEIARLQEDVMQQQLAVANAQTKELFELSAKIAQQTLETVTASATKTLELLRKTA
jgi:hypothetical protein